MSTKGVPKHNVARLDDYRRCPVQSDLAKLKSFLLRHNIQNRITNNKKCSFGWGDYGGLQELRLAISAEQLRDFVFEAREENALSLAYKKAIASPQVEKELEYMINQPYLSCVDILFQRFAGQIEALNPMQEFLFTSLDLPNKLTLSFYFKDGEIKLASSSLANEWTKSQLLVKDDKPVFVVSQKNDDMLLTAFAKRIYTKPGRPFTVCYKQLIRDRERGRLVSVDILNYDDKYPSIYIVFYKIEPGSESLRFQEDYKINSVPKEEISKDQIMTFQLPVNAFYHQGSSERRELPSAVIESLAQREGMTLQPKENITNGDPVSREIVDFFNGLGVKMAMARIRALPLIKSMMQEIDAHI